MNKPWVIGHRGTAFHAPQNTKAAFMTAYRMNADGIETDLQMTRDDKIVVNHNYFIDDNSDGKGAVCNLTYDELVKFDYGKYKGDEWAGEKILTLDELIEIVKDFKVINLELKSALHKDRPFAKLVVDAVDKYGITDKVIFSSFDVNLVREIKSYGDQYKVGLLTMPDHYNGKLREMCAYFFSTYPVSSDYVDSIMKAVNEDVPSYELAKSLDFKIDYFHPHWSTVIEHPECVKEFADMGIGCNPWTVDDKEVMKKCMDLGCTGIISNLPDTLYDVVNGK